MPQTQNPLIVTEMHELQDVQVASQCGQSVDGADDAISRDSDASLSSQQDTVISPAPTPTSTISSTSVSRWRRFLGSPELVGVVSLATLILTILAVTMAICSTLWASKSFTFGACVSLAQIDRFTQSCNDTIAGGIPSFVRRSPHFDLHDDSFDWDTKYLYSRREFRKTSSLQEAASVFLLLASGFSAFALSCVLDDLPLGSRFSGRKLLSEGSLLVRKLGVVVAMFWCEIAFYGLYPEDGVAYVEIGIALVVVEIGAVLSVRWRRLGLRNLRRAEHRLWRCYRSECVARV